MTKSLGKAFLLLELIAEGRRTLTDIARESNLPPSTAHRLLADLVRYGVVEQHDRSYRLGVRLIEYGEKAKREQPIGQVAREPMRQLAELTQETVHLGILDDADIVYVEKVSGKRGLQMASYVGLRTPAQCTAMGKVLIAAEPADTWPDRYQDIPPRTANTIQSLEEFLVEIERVKERGYALDQEENEVGIRCVAAPIRGSDGSVLAAVSLSGATIYITDERQQQLVPEVLRCADAISRGLGAALDDPLEGRAVR